MSHAQAILAQLKQGLEEETVDGELADGIQARIDELEAKDD